MNIKIKLEKWLMAFLLLVPASCVNDDVSTQTLQEKSPQTSSSITTFVCSQPASRTIMERLNDGRGRFYWTPDDRILVVNDRGHIEQSRTNSIVNGHRSSQQSSTIQAASIAFFFEGSFTKNQYLVYYTRGNSNYVNISKEQVQDLPNTPRHLGKSGDCGTAIATKQADGVYNFVLTHHSSYLCFLPRTSDPILHNARLMKIEVIADKTIADSYALSETGIGSSQNFSLASSVITLKTGGTAGFALTNSVAEPTTNAAFMVIPPGTHTLSINYWVKLQDGREGTVVQALDTKTFASNMLYDITCDLKMPNCDSYVFEPVANYPDKSDFSPVNDLFWYVDRGNPTLEKNQFWTHNGNVYQGGLWLKRKGKIPGFDSNVAPNGINYITKAEDAPTVWSTLTGATTAYHQVFLPYTNTPVSAKDYFFLPNFTVAKNPAELWHADYCSQNTVVGHSDYIWYLFFNSGRVGVHIGPAGLLRMPPIIPKYAVFGQPAD